MRNNVGQIGNRPNLLIITAVLVAALFIAVMVELFESRL